MNELLEAWEELHRWVWAVQRAQFAVREDPYDWDFFYQWHSELIGHLRSEYDVTQENMDADEAERNWLWNSR